MIVGTEWLIEATGCDPAALRDEIAALKADAGRQGSLAAKALAAGAESFSLASGRAIFEDALQ